MSRTKSILSLVMVLVFMFTTAMMTGMTAFAANPRDIWYVGWEDDTYQAYIGWTGNSGQFFVDTENYYKDSRYSLKLSNEDYNYCRIEKRVAVEPLTTYKFSAMVKYSGYKLDPEAEINSTGISLAASIPGTATYYGNSSAYNGKEWEKLEMIFTTPADQNMVNLSLWNGAQIGHCKGTAWVSDIKLEKAEVTNQWDVLFLVFKNVNAKIKTDSETIVCKDSFNKADVKYLRTKVIEPLKDTLHVMADELVNIRSVDTYTIDTALTAKDLIPYGDTEGYWLDFNSELVSKSIRKYLDKKDYQQIIVFAPLYDIAKVWLGLGGGTFDGVNRCLLTYKSGTESYTYPNKNGKPFPESAVIHEILHGVNNDSDSFDSTTPYLHENVGIYQNDYNYDDGWYQYQCDYMTKNLPDGRGIDPRAFWRPSGEYTLITDDMTAGGEIDTSALPLKLSKVKATKIADQFYTGKSIKPDVVLKDGKYTLKKGVDYTLSYKNNKKVGTATVTIKGKGIYTGTKKVTFQIVKKPLSTEALTVKATKTSSKIKVSWNKAEGAEKYVVWVSKNGKDFKVYKEYSSKKTSMTIKCNSKTTYQFAVTAYIPELGQYTNYGYSDVV